MVTGNMGSKSPEQTNPGADLEPEGDPARMRRFLTIGLPKEIDGYIQAFKKKASHNRSIAKRLRLGGIALSFTAALFLGLDLGQVNEFYPLLLINLAFVATLAAGLLRTIEAFGSYREMWLRYMGTVNRLRELRRKVSFSSRAGDLKELKKLHEEMEQVLQSTNEGWAELREKGGDE